MNTALMRQWSDNRAVVVTKNDNSQTLRNPSLWIWKERPTMVDSEGPNQEDTALLFV